MSSSRFDIHPGAIDTILHGPTSVAQKKRQAEKIKDAWQGNIHRITGVTEASIQVEVEGSEVLVTAESSGGGENPSAWFWLEYGTSRTRAQHPGRRAIRRS